VPLIAGLASRSTGGTGGPGGNSPAVSVAAGLEPPTCPNLDFFAKGLDARLYPTRLDDRPFGSPTTDLLKDLQNPSSAPESRGAYHVLRKSEPDTGSRGRWFDGYLRANGWESEYQSVQKLLDHLSRRTKSESRRMQYLETVATLCRREGRTPD